MSDSTHRFEHLEILEELRADLLAAARRQEARRGATGGLRSWLARRLNAPVMAVVLLLGGGAAAVAATGVLSGSPVRQQGKPRPNAGFGLPVAGGSRLLALQAPDPQGGLPWGMRVVRTTRGETCVQIARLDGHQLGQLGIDGAFHDDGRFHALTPNDLPEVRAQGAAADDDCVAPKETFAGEIDGLDRNAVANPQGNTIALSGRREVSYGLLGPHALAVTYRSGTRTLTSPVLRGLGAYLIVLRAKSNRYLGSTGAAPGGDYADDLEPAGPTGALVAITSRYGRTVCRDNGNQPIVRCHLRDHPLGPERTPSQSGI
jgi:hypothetical protein